MSNLYKRSSVISKNARVIDYNDVIRNKIETFREELQQHRLDADGFINGLHVDVVEALTTDNEDNDSSVKDKTMQEQQSLETAVAEAEDIVNSAHEDANNIIAEANNEAEQIKQNAYSVGKTEGLMAADNEINARRNEIEQELTRRKEKLQDEYDHMKAAIEPELVNVLTDVFRKVTYAISDDNQDMILNLINGVMHNTENNKNFVIKVSPDDYKFVINNQGKIYCAMSKEVQMDIIEDRTMTRNQCIIETDSGVYDCSLDIQLESLIKDIKILSCI